MQNNFIWDVNGVNIVPPTQDLLDNGFPLEYPPKSGEMNSILNSITSSRAQVGEIREFGGLKTSIDIEKGFLPANGDSLSRTGSGATYADDRYHDLYVFCWNNFSNSICPVVGGRGASAEADWSANKFLSLLNCSGTGFAGYSATPGSIFNAPVGTRVGSETVTLTELELPVVQPTLNDPGHTHTTALNYRAVQEGLYFDSVDFRDFEGHFDGTEFPVSSSATTGISIEPFGGGQAHNNVQPTIIGNYMIKW